MARSPGPLVGSQSPYAIPVTRHKEVSQPPEEGPRAIPSYRKVRILWNRGILLPGAKRPHWSDPQTDTSWKAVKDSRHWNESFLWRTKIEITPVNFASTKPYLSLFSPEYNLGCYLHLCFLGCNPFRLNKCFSPSVQPKCLLGLRDPHSQGQNCSTGGSPRPKLDTSPGLNQEKRVTMRVMASLRWSVCMGEAG